VRGRSGDDGVGDGIQRKAVSLCEVDAVSGHGILLLRLKVQGRGRGRSSQSLWAIDR
jgi:hypothetical protein